MAFVLSEILQETQFDDNGELLSAGKIYWYNSATSNLEDIFTTSTGAAKHTNPITLNSRGEPPSEIWLTDTVVYKAVLVDSFGTTIRTFDNLNIAALALVPPAAVTNEWVLNALVPTYVDGKSFTVVGDQESVFTNGKRIRTTNTGGFVYSTVLSSTCVAGVTTVDLSNDGVTVIDAGISAIYFSILDNVNLSVPEYLNASSGNIFRKNALINGDFNVWQRGTTAVTTTNSYTADRWRTTIVSGTASFAQEVLALGEADIAGMSGLHSPQFAMKVSVTGSTDVDSEIVLCQRIEDVNTFAGKNAIFSFYGKSAAPSKVFVEVVQNFGAGGAPSADVITAGSAVNLTTSYERHTVQLAIPSISGKTLGTASNYLALRIWMSAGTNYNARVGAFANQTGTFYFSRAQLELGIRESMYEWLPFYESLNQCKRYYQKSFPYATKPVTGAGYTGASCGTASIDGAVGHTIAMGIRLSPSMRYTGGTGVVYNTNEANNFAHQIQTNVATTAAAITGVGDTAFYLTATPTAASVIGEKFAFHWTIDNDL